ncbi:inner-membrane translocator (plasmid) [Klebsiella pneumoniae]|nr:inner-membrane translocator [Klebsiella pneumoniae]
MNNSKLSRLAGYHEFWLGIMVLVLIAGLSFVPMNFLPSAILQMSQPVMPF